MNRLRERSKIYVSQSYLLVVSQTLIFEVANIRGIASEILIMLRGFRSLGTLKKWLLKITKLKITVKINIPTNKIINKMHILLLA